MKSWLLTSGVLVSFLFMNGIIYGQTIAADSVKLEQNIEPLNYDTNYIVSYADIFTLRFILVNKKNEFSIIDKISDNRVDYLPNSRLNFGFGMSYKWASVNLSMSFPGTNNDDETFGKTKRLDLQSNLYMRKFVVDLIFQFYRGFYVANPTLINSGWKPGDPYPIRSDIKSFAMGFTGNYIFNNKRFSYRSAFVYNERQKKSAGSFTVGGGMLMFNLKSDTGLVPKEIFPDTVPAINFDKINLNSIYALGGYAHTFVIRNWYFSLALGLGSGFSTSKSRTTDDIKSKSNPNFSIVSDFRGSVGYNSDLIYVGLSWFTGAFAVNSSKDLLVTFSLTKINLAVGYRFYKWFYSTHGKVRPKKFF